MSEAEVSNGKARIAYAAAVDDEIAPDLPTLMERMERTRKFLRIEREYIKMTVIGVAFVIGGTMFQYSWLWRLYLVLFLLLTPWAYGWLTLPRLRLANAFRNETMPFLLRDYGRWNYAHEGSHFPREEFFRTGFLNPDEGISITSIMTGERYGVPLQLAIVAAWKPPLFGIYRGNKPIFAGWVSSIRLPSLPGSALLILPKDTKPRAPLCANWQTHAFSPTHQLWAPAGMATDLPPDLIAHLMPVLATVPGCQVGLSGGVLWLLAPGDGERFNLAQDFTVALNEPAPYQKARAQLAELFAVVDKIVWPSGGS